MSHESYDRPVVVDEKPDVTFLYEVFYEPPHNAVVDQYEVVDALERVAEALAMPASQVLPLIDHFFALGGRVPTIERLSRISRGKIAKPGPVFPTFDSLRPAWEELSDQDRDALQAIKDHKNHR